VDSIKIAAYLGKVESYAPLIVTEGAKVAQSLRKRGHTAVGLLAFPPSSAALTPLAGRQVILRPGISKTRPIWSISARIYPGFLMAILKSGS